VTAKPQGKRTSKIVTGAVISIIKETETIKEAAIKVTIIATDITTRTIRNPVLIKNN